MNDPPFVTAVVRRAIVSKRNVKVSKIEPLWSPKPAHIFHQTKNNVSSGNNEDRLLRDSYFHGNCPTILLHLHFRPEIGRENRVEDTEDGHEIRSNSNCFLYVIVLETVWKKVIVSLNNYRIWSSFRVL